MLNKSIFMGRLTHEPELRHTASNIPVMSFSVAVERDYKDADTGERGVDFIDVVAWRQTAEFICNYFSKGQMIIVEGRLQMRNWQDADGNQRRMMEVQAEQAYFGGGKPDGQKEAPEK